MNKLQVESLFREYRERAVVFWTDLLEEREVEFTREEFKKKNGYAIFYFVIEVDVSIENSKSVEWRDCQTFRKIVGQIGRPCSLATSSQKKKSASFKGRFGMG